MNALYYVIDFLFALNIFEVHSTRDYWHPMRDVFLPT